MLSFVVLTFYSYLITLSIIFIIFASANSSTLSIMISSLSLALDSPAGTPRLLVDITFIFKSST